MPKILSESKRLDSIFTIFKNKNPSPKCELFYNTPYQLLVSVVLSAQATDKSVNLAMEPVYRNGLTPADMLKMGEANFLKIIRRIGLAPTKAKNVLGLTKLILDKHHGEIPSTRADLEALPGVGRKTANVVLAEIFKEPTLAVDTHVFRVSQRLGLQNESSAEKAELVLIKKIDKKWLPEAHHWFILHGRYVCVARNPKCAECLISKYCASKLL